MLCSVTEVRPGLSRMGENVSHREVMSMIWPSDRPSPVLECVEVVASLSEYVGTSIPSESSSKISSAQQDRALGEYHSSNMFMWKMQ